MTAFTQAEGRSMVFSSVYTWPCYLDMPSVCQVPAWDACLVHVSPSPAPSTPPLRITRLPSMRLHLHPQLRILRHQDMHPCSDRPFVRRKGKHAASPHLDQVRCSTAPARRRRQPTSPLVSHDREGRQRRWRLIIRGQAISD